MSNHSTNEPYSATFFFEALHLADYDEKIPLVTDGDVVSGIPQNEIAPGETVTYQVGFTIPRMDELAFELDVDGPSSSSLFWSEDGEIDNWSI